MNPNDYLELSARTASNLKEEDRVVSAARLVQMLAIAHSANKADCSKRLHFYKDPNTSERYEKADQKITSMQDKVWSTLPDQVNLSEDQMNAFHAILGIASEVGELVEEFVNSLLENRDFDRVNFKEEIGDQLWYQAMLLRVINGTFPDSMQKNISKLEARYPDKFKTEAALNRNLDVERKILEND